MDGKLEDIINYLHMNITVQIIDSIIQCTIAEFNHFVWKKGFYNFFYKILNVIIYKLYFFSFVETYYLEQNNYFEYFL